MDDLPLSTIGDLALAPVRGDDLPFVREMLHVAAFWRGPQNAPSVEVALRQPPLARYVDGWGRPGDRGLVARVDAARVGAVWVRVFAEEAPGYGWVDARTPELSMAVVPGHRGLGIGRCLLTAMLAQARLDGVQRLSLSVAADNPARSLYRRAGFEVVGEAEDSLTMLADLR